MLIEYNFLFPGFWTSAKQSQNVDTYYLIDTILERLLRSKLLLAKLL